VSALLKEESDEPSMAKKCLSCDRAFNKLSFKDLELVQQVRLSQDLCLPMFDVLWSCSHTSLQDVAAMHR